MLMFTSAMAHKTGATFHSFRYIKLYKHFFGIPRVVFQGTKIFLMIFDPMSENVTLWLNFALSTHNCSFAKGLQLFLYLSTQTQMSGTRKLKTGNHLV